MRTLSRNPFYFLLAALAWVTPAVVGPDITSAQDRPASPQSVLESDLTGSDVREVPRYARTKTTTQSQSQSPAAQSDAGSMSIDFDPYQVFVAHTDAFAHCGPSTEYYRTDPLRFGQTLEVYTETSDGWLGIRPPADSFCWLPAETVQMDDSGELGTVIEDRTVSWIGTQLGRARQYRWQVQLAKGEQVTVIGRSEREGPDGPQLWLRIVPPSGEYRWVHRDAVVLSTEELVEVARQSGSNAPSAVAAYPIQDESGVSGSIVSDDPVFGSSILDQSRPVGSGVRPANASDQAFKSDQNTDAPNRQTAMDVLREEGLLASLEFMTRPKIQDIGAQPQTNPSAMTADRSRSVGSLPEAGIRGDDSNWVSGRNRGTRNPRYADVGGEMAVESTLDDGFQVSPRRFSNDESVIQVGATTSVDPVLIQARVAAIEQQVQGADADQLNLLLARLMAIQASGQEIAVVAGAAERIATSGVDSLATQRARLVVETAQRYQRVAMRRDGGSVVTADSGSLNSLTAGVVTASGDRWSQSPVARNNPLKPADAFPNQGEVLRQEGYLVEVYSARSNSPPYALTDKAGRTVAYLSPMPGVNLRSLLNQQVGVVGSVGSIAGLDTPHLMVTQAIRMDR